MHDIPASDSFQSPLKKGFLQKLVGRGWLYSGSWKSRYCVLDGSKFYFYEKEQSKGNEKSCGVINLDYYDLCEENNSKDKKNPHVFIIGTSVRGFFDNRQQFAAETSDDMQSWIQSIQAAISEARISRTKPGRKRHLDGKSPDLSNSSQESGGASTTCLVNIAKDRAKGPQGRRLPQRKSMMPTSRSDEINDMRQRSISCSSPMSADNVDEADEKESSSPRLQSPSETKWLSLSMEEMERGSDDAFETQRSSSAFDIPQQKETPHEESTTPFKPVHKRLGNLMGKHAALTKELEMKLKAGRTPGGRRLHSESEDEEPRNEEEAAKNLEHLTSKVNSTKNTLNVLEEKVSVLSKKIEATNENSEKASTQVGDILLQVTVTLQEAERINEECKRALAEVNKAKAEYQMLSEKCKETLANLNIERESQNHVA